MSFQPFLRKMQVDKLPPIEQYTIGPCDSTMEQMLMNHAIYKIGGPALC